MKVFNKYVLFFLLSLSPVVNASVDQFSDMSGGVDLHVEKPTPYIFDTKDLDSGNVILTNDYNFTVNKSGLYRVSYQINWSTDNLSRRQVKTFILKNGLDILNGSYAYGYARREDQAGNATNNSSFYVKLAAEDYLQLIYKKESNVIGQAHALPNESTISFELVAEMNNLEPLKLSGQYGNIALIGTNNLAIQNYSASSTYHSDSPAGAFDGFTFTDTINSDAVQKVNRGTWVSNAGHNTNQWLQVDFNRDLNVTGFRVVINSAAQRFGRLPKEVTVQTSNDGITFDNIESFVLENTTDQVITLNSIINTKYFRLFITNNYGDQYIQIDELELFK